MTNPIQTRDVIAAYETGRHYAKVTLRSHERQDAPADSLVSKAIAAIDRAMWMIWDYRKENPQPITALEFFADDFAAEPAAFDSEEKALSVLRNQLSAILLERCPA